MQTAVSAPVPRSVQAQMFFDNVNRDGGVDASVEAESTIHPCGHPTGADRNTDLDNAYQELVFMNGPQQQNRQRDHRRREGATGTNETSYAQISAESKQRLKQLQQQQQQLHLHLQQPSPPSLPRPSASVPHQATAQMPPSPPITPTSPESPSSLAIHLYVHHHHHHHPQPDLTVTTQSSTSFPTASLPSPVSPPLLVEDPMTAVMSTSSPPVVVAPQAVRCLLPPLSIPEYPSDKNTMAMQLPSPTTPPTDTSAWLTQSTTTTSVSNAASNAILEDLSFPTARQPSPPNRRHRQQQRPCSQSLTDLPDPMMSAQLLSTISEADLGRLYVHAAHHLHSHQPIRCYVLMKMIMTQAELIQYGRLRAEMPRAPGPSTGALPKRTGFGTEANKGLSARPKVSSNLAQCVVRTAGKEGDEDKEGCGRRLINVPWARSLSSLAMLSTGLSLRSSGADQKKRPSSWYEGMLGSTSADADALQGVMGGSSKKDREKKLGGGLCSSSESDLYCARRLEELELGVEKLDEQDLLEGDDDGDLDRKDRVEDETEEMDYWTMIRDRKNRSRRRQIPSSQGKQQWSHEQLQYSTRPPCSEEFEQICPDSPAFQTCPSAHPSIPSRQMPQQQHCRQLIPPSQVISSTSSSISTSLSQTGAWNRNNRVPYAPLSTKPKGLSSSKKWPSKRRNSHGHVHTLLPSTSGTHSSSSSAFLFSFSESHGFSSLVMLSLLFGCLYLFQSTNQLYNLQSAFLSIIL